MDKTNAKTSSSSKLMFPQQAAGPRTKDTTLAPIRRKKRKILFNQQKKGKEKRPAPLEQITELPCLAASDESSVRSNSVGLCGEQLCPTDRPSEVQPVVQPPKQQQPSPDKENIQTSKVTNSYRKKK